MAESEAQMEVVSIKKIKPFDNNPRNNAMAVEGVAKSITQFGFLVPIVVDKDGVIITGHTRYEASQKLGMKEVPIIRATHLDEAQIRAFRIADNRLHENSSWDTQKLAQEMSILESMGFDLSETGFSMEEISCLVEPVKADCLEDLSADAVCGDIPTITLSASKQALFSLGVFRFYLPLDKYNQWRMDKLQEHGSAEGVVNWVTKALNLPQETQIQHNQ